MKIKKFIATDINKLIAQVKQELGEEAVIISTTELANGSVELVAAIETNTIDIDDNNELEETSSTYSDVAIRKALSYHELTSQAQSQILAKCRYLAQKNMLTDDKIILEKTLDDMLPSYSFFESSSSIKLFMGAPGGGKSTAIAKLATLAKMRNISCLIISTDSVRAGANHQLKAFADILLSDFVVVKEVSRLASKVEAAKSQYQLILIDTPGINPFISEQANKLMQIVNKIDCDKILVMDMGKNSYEAVETAKIFAQMGAKYLLPTKLDLTRRIGAMLSIAVMCNFGINYASVSSSIAKGIAKVSGASVSRLVLD